MTACAAALFSHITRKANAAVADTMPLPLSMLPTPIRPSGPSGKPQFHNHSPSALPSGLSDTVTTTANAVASSEYTSTNSNTSPLPLILMPILTIFGLGGLYFLWHQFHKRRKAKHMAPSAEFQKYRLGSTPLADVEGRAAVAAEGRLRYAHRDSGGEESEGGNNGSPPSFPPGLFKDPIFEKGVAICLANQSGRGYRLDNIA